MKICLVLAEGAYMMIFDDYLVTKVISHEVTLLKFYL